MDRVRGPRRQMLSITGRYWQSLFTDEESGDQRDGVTSFFWLQVASRARTL